MICPQAQNVLLMFSKTGLLFIWTHFPLCSDTVAIFILELYLNCKFPPWYIPLFFWLFSDCILEKRKKTFLIKQSINNWILVTFHTNFSYATGPWVKCYWHLWQPEKKSWTRLMNDILIHMWKAETCKWQANTRFTIRNPFMSLKQGNVFVPEAKGQYIQKTKPIDIYIYIYIM